MITDAQCDQIFLGLCVLIFVYVHIKTYFLNTQNVYQRFIAFLLLFFCSKMHTLYIRNVCLSGHASLPLDREVSRVCMLSCQTQQQVRPSDDAGFSGIPKLRSDLTQNFGDCLFTVYWSKIIKASFVYRNNQPLNVIFEEY